MYCLVSFMMITFLMGGGSMLVAGIRQFVRRRWVVQRMETAVGTILRVHQERRCDLDNGSNSSRDVTILNFPVIQFRLPNGHDVQFRSEVGDTGRISQFRSGMQLPVLYDPQGEEAPLIKSWSGVYLASLMYVIAGTAFIGGATMVWVAFGHRILALQ